MTCSSPIATSCLAAVLLAATGCVDAPSGGTAGTSIYVYDNASSAVMVWKDVDKLYASPAAPPLPDYTLTAGQITNRSPLAWGGLAVDATHNCLYMVAASGGAVTCITQLSNQTGAISQASDLTTFNLGQSTDDYANGSFGQAYVDPAKNVLYVCETQPLRAATRVWVVNGASGTLGLTVPVSSIIPAISNDQGYSGVAAGQNGLVYGYFPNGDTLYSSLFNNVPLDGGRIRQGTASGFFSNQIISTNLLVGPLTGLSDASTTYGTLAYDSVNNLLYCSRQASSAATTSGTVLPAVEVFTPGQFTSSNFNVAPATSPVLSDTASTLPNLRFIVHAGIKDWMAGADALSGSPTNLLHLWKAPSSGGASVTVTLPAGVEVGGIALDGSN